MNAAENAAEHHPPNTTIDFNALELVEAWSIQQRYLEHNVRSLGYEQRAVVAGLLVLAQEIGSLRMVLAEFVEASR